MTSTTTLASLAPPKFQAPKKLDSGEKVWILTGVRVSWSSFYSYSPEQQRFDVGAYDLQTGNVGVFTFGRDDLVGMLRAEMTPPPWNGPQPAGLLMKRRATNENTGRHPAMVSLVAIAPELHSILGPAREILFAIGFSPSSVLPCEWNGLVERANRENAIEAAILRTNGWFASRDIQRATGFSGSQVGYILSRFVAENRLETTGTKRGTRYRLPMVLIERADWNG